MAGKTFEETVMMNVEYGKLSANIMMHQFLH